MFIISAGEGLGNQMFEYAFYLKMKKVYKNSIIKLDPQFAFPPIHNGYEVERIFGLNSEKASWEEVEKYADLDYLVSMDRFKSIRSKIKRKLGICKRSFVLQEDRTKYYDRFFSLDESRSYYLYGPFANSMYFEDIKDEIVSAYTFPDVPNDLVDIVSKIKNSESVSIHIRRGDYVSQGLDLLDMDYYDHAIDLLTKGLKKNIDDLLFVIFSDDINIARGMFVNYSNVLYVSGNKDDNSFRDMQLMSMCKHNIMANSTFSFWGAYLNRNRNKIVVGSKKPVAGYKYPFTCDGWTLI